MRKAQAPGLGGPEVQVGAVSEEGGWHLRLSLVCQTRVGAPGVEEGVHLSAEAVHQTPGWRPPEVRVEGISGSARCHKPRWGLQEQRGPCREGWSEPRLRRVCRGALDQAG